MESRSLPLVHRHGHQFTEREPHRLVASAATRSAARGVERIGLGEDRRTRDQHVGAGVDRDRRGLDVDAAVDLEVERQRVALDLSPRGLSTFPITSAMKAWPPKPGKTVISNSRSMSPRNGATAEKGVSGLAASPTRRPSDLRLVDQARGRADLDVHRAAVRTRQVERLEVASGLAHHQVAVEEPIAVVAQRRDDRRADREIRHEVPVHDVNVQPVGLGVDLTNAGAEVAEVRREYRRSEAKVAGRASDRSPSRRAA